MDRISLNLPELILLESFGSNYKRYIDAVYQVFRNDYVINKPIFRGIRLGLKRHPLFQNREYTFYHMTHSGREENNRIPNLRRCERMGWGKPSIENCDRWRLKVWPQRRNNEERICIWLELDEEPDYIVILAKRKDYLLPWTAFVLEYQHQKRKKLKEYNEYLKNAETAQ